MIHVAFPPPCCWRGHRADLEPRDRGHKLRPHEGTQRRAGAWALCRRVLLVEVIPRLQAAGLNVTSVQNPLTTLPEAVAAAERVLARQDGPTVLVGHSFSGMIVTEAGVHPNVSALVYVAARAPDAGEDYAALAKQFPTPPRRPASFSMAMKDASARRPSCAISQATCRRRRPRRFMRPSGPSTRLCSPARQRRRPGGQSPAGMRCRPKTARSTLISSATWRGAWARERSRSRRATYR